MCSNQLIDVAGDGLASLAAGVAVLAAEDVITTPVAALAEEIVALHRHLAQVQGHIVRRVAAVDMRTNGQIEGHLSTASWLQGACSTTHGYASDLVRTSRWLDSRPETAAALQAGSISYPHAQVITRTLADLPVRHHDSAEKLLLEATQGLDPGRLRVVGTRMRETINRDHAERSSRHDHGRRYLHVSQTLDGMVAIDGRLDAEAGGVLLSALMPLSAPLGPDDTRVPAQRRADALTEMAQQVLTTGHVPTVSSHRPSVNVTIGLPSLRKQPGTPGGELNWTGPVTAEMVQRIGCDANITRIVLGPKSEVLDVGRSKRLVTPAQRKALAIRDNGCTWPGCSRPHWWTDAHHVVPWHKGGATDLANLRLLCRTHHRRAHDQERRERSP